MTDNEIIKAFEICYISDADGDLCGDCCFHDSSPCTCSKELLKHVFDLINRQKAEIERLNAMVAAAEDYLHPLPFKTAYDEEIQKAKSEAIREFVEKLKEKASHETYHDSYGSEKFSYTISTVDFDDIDQTVDEMDGDNK